MTCVAVVAVIATPDMQGKPGLAAALISNRCTALEIAICLEEGRKLA